MKPLLPSLSLCLALASSSCAPARGWAPVRSEPGPAPALTLVWVGRGEAERFEGGAWVRRPEFDYEFSVEQRRFVDRWESVKSLRRHHPAYDGSAGPREQTYFFQLRFDAATAGQDVWGQVDSSLGSGRLRTDGEFRAATLELDAQVSRFAPFDRYRITQAYDYEGGALTETVELNQGATPWVRNHEVARLFAAQRFDGPPTRR